MPSEERSGRSTQGREEFLLEVRGLSIDYQAGSEAPLHAVLNLSFGIRPGEVLGVMGESGSGKSTLALALLGLLPRNATIRSGSVMFRGRDLLRLRQAELQQVRGATISYIFQEPGIALNPVKRAGDQISEVLRAHNSCDQEHRRKTIDELLKGALRTSAAEIYSAFPHELSGGQQQRIAIAQALVCKPALLIADEPTSALDVTTQAEALAYLKESTTRLKTAVIMITHDPTTLTGLADRLLVIHKGELVEEDTFAKVCERPIHPYTRSIFESIAPQLPAGNQQKDHCILVAQGVSKKYVEKRWFGGRRAVQALDDVSLDLRAGSTTGLVGESGSGKSTLARCLAAIEKPDAGEVFLEGRDLFRLSSRELREQRRSIQLIFQNTAAALNPWLTLEAIVAEPLAIGGLPQRRQREQALALLEKVGLPLSRRSHRPNELSGGQRQRLAIARALGANPKVLIFDEALSGLDLPIQSEIIELLRKLQNFLSIAYLFITHDLRMAGRISDKIAVMHAGRIVEYDSAVKMFSEPEHPRTRSLLQAIPKLPRRPAEA